VSVIGVLAADAAHKIKELNSIFIKTITLG
jgi:hypothetical protein